MDLPSIPGFFSVGRPVGSDANGELKRLFENQDKKDFLTYFLLKSYEDVTSRTYFKLINKKSITTAKTLVKMKSLRIVMPFVFRI